MRKAFDIATDILLYLAMAFVFVLIFGFLIATIVVLSVSTDEHPNKPLRVWLGVSLGLWLVSTIMSCIPNTATLHTVTVNDMVEVRGEGGGNPVVANIVHLVCVGWWGVGLYWMISGGQNLIDGAPVLFWYTAVVLGLAAAGGVLLFCFCSCVLFCGGMIAGIVMRVNGAKAEAEADVDSV